MKVFRDVEESLKLVKSYKFLKVLQNEQKSWTANILKTDLNLQFKLFMAVSYKIFNSF